MPFNGSGCLQWCTWLCGLKEGASYPSVLSITALLDFLLAGNGATGREDGCSGFERPTTRFELEKNALAERNLILQSTRPGVDILSCFQNVQHHKVARATQTFFSSDAQLRSCQN